MSADPNDGHEGPAGDDLRGGTTQSPGEGPVVPNTVFIPVEGSDDTFLVIGEQPTGPGLTPVPFLPPSSMTRTEVGEAIARSAGFGNVAVQGIDAWSKASGLVRLAPETLAALRSGAQPMVSGGWNLGALTRGGKITQQVMWAPAGAMGIVPVLAAIGPAIALIGIQWQLGKITRLQKENLALSREILHELKSDQWAEVESHHKFVLKSLDEARAVGQVTDMMWHHIQGQGTGTVLDQNRRVLTGRVERNLTTLRTLSSGKQRREWMETNVPDLIRDVHHLVLVEQAWLAYTFLRMLHLSRSDDEADARLIRHIDESTKTEYVATLGMTSALADSVYLHFGFRAQLSPSLSLRLGDRSWPVTEIRDAVAPLARMTAELAGSESAGEGSEPAVPGSQFTWVGNTSSEFKRQVGERLRWLLGRDESVRAIAYGHTDAVWQKRHLHYFVATNRRLLILNDFDFIDHGNVVREISGSKIVSARTERSGPYGGPQVIVSHDGEYVALQFRHDVLARQAQWLAENVPTKTFQGMRGTTYRGHPRV